MTTPDTDWPAPEGGIIALDVIEKVDAGAQLVYALWHCDADIVLALPDTVQRAIIRAQQAYSVGRYRSGDYLRSAGSTSPLKVI